MYLLQTDLTVTCMEARHVPVAVVAVVMILGVTVGFPVSMLAVLWRNRARLSDEAFTERYGVLYTQYRPERFYMTLVWMAMTAAAALGLLVFAASAVAQIAVVASVLFVVLSSIVALRPFLLSWKNVTFAGLLLLTVASLVGLPMLMAMMMMW